MTQRHLLRFESRHQPVLSRRAFLRRLAGNFVAAALLVGGSLLIGMAGYSGLEGMSGIDAFANASMILSGMGPLEPIKTWGGKLFAGIYALYSGLAVLVAASVILAPIVHRLLHQFHVDDEGDDKAG